MVGELGRVVAISPNADKDDWEISVFLVRSAEVWGFDPTELRACEPSDDGAKLAPLLIELTLRAATERSTALADVTESIERVIGPVVAESTLEEVGSDILLKLRLWPSVDVSDAVEKLIRSVRDGWLTIFDDGWALEAHWDSAAASAAFIAAVVERAVLMLRPWASPVRRNLDLGDMHEPDSSDRAPAEPPSEG